MSTPDAAPPGATGGRPPGPAPGGVEIARGAFLGGVALLASNLRAVFTFLIARLLGQAALGQFGLAYATVDLLSKVGTFGLDSGATALVARREAAWDRAGSRRLFRRAVGWGVALSLATAAAGIAAGSLLGSRLGQPAALVAATSLLLAALPGIALYRIANGVSRGLRLVQHEIVSRGLVETLVTIAAFLAAFALGLRGLAPVAAVLLGTAAGGIAALLLAARGLARPVSGHLLRADLAEPGLLAFSAPIAGYALLNLLIMRMDVLLLGLFVGRVPGLTLESFGVFCAAVEVAGGMRKVRQAFDPIFTPVLAAQVARGEALAQRATIAQVSRWVMATQLPLVAILALSGDLVLSLFGPGFASGASWLAILAVAHGTSSFAGLAETVILVERPALNLFNSAATVLVQAAASLWLIPRHGATGAALAMLLAYLFQGLLRWAELRLVFHRPWPWRSLRTPLVAFAVALVPAEMARVALPGTAGSVAAGLVFLAAYVGVWMALGLEPADRDTLRELGLLERRSAPVC